jgi:cysteine-rich repeat protein
VPCVTDADCGGTTYTCEYNAGVDIRCTDECLLSEYCDDDSDCPPDEECSDNGICVPKCGNGVVDPGENCTTCPEDAGCTDGLLCCPDGTCGSSCEGNCNNNGICEPEKGESCACADCDGKQDGCAAGLVCINEICSDKCGNGVVDPGENCTTCPDDAGCSEGLLCCPDGTCGATCDTRECNNNKICEPGENCECSDCENEQDGCAAGLICVNGQCSDTAFCGDGNIDPGEDCQTCPDDAGCGPGLCCNEGVCSEDCGVSPCNNNGVCEPSDGENCSCADCEGKQDGCIAGLVCLGGQCRGGGICGNGILEMGEDCDDGNNADGDGCDKNCKREFCGDGIVQPELNDEVCDNGSRCMINGELRNSCLKDADCNTCIIIPGTSPQVSRCGGDEQNGQICLTDDDCVNAGYQCVYDTDAEELCNDECHFATGTCGNGIVEGLEECDDGNNVDSDGCSRNCLNEFCGDGVVQADNPLAESCDNGSVCSQDGRGCREDTDCRFCGVVPGTNPPVKRCGGMGSDPTICETDADCVNSAYTCVYDVLEDENCNEQCHDDTLCGNGRKDAGENCITCPDDAGCANGLLCCPNGSCGEECEQNPCNNDGICDANENCTCADCNGEQDGCIQGAVCINEVCSENCGDGKVDFGENCVNCRMTRVARRATNAAQTVHAPPNVPKIRRVTITASVTPERTVPVLIAREGRMDVWKGWFALETCVPAIAVTALLTPARTVRPAQMMLVAQMDCSAAQTAHAANLAKQFHVIMMASVALAKHATAQIAKANRMGAAMDWFVLMAHAATAAATVLLMRGRPA